MVAQTESSAASASASSASSSSGSAAVPSAAEAAAAASTSPPRKPVSLRKLRANRRNAQKSTGPRTPLGKARSAKNATTHGIFCRDLLLEGENKMMFRNLRESLILRLRPQDALELMFVDRIVQAQWRLNRCQAAEHAAHRNKAVSSMGRADRKIQRILRRQGVTSRQELLDDPQPGDIRLLNELDLLEKMTELDIYTPGYTLLLGMCSNHDRTFERLSNYEQRLERTIHRALRELRLLRDQKMNQAWENLPESPFAGQWVLSDEPEEPEEQEEAAAQEALCGLGVPPERSSAATESAELTEEDEELGEDAQATQQATEQARHSPVKNEPTADATAASDGPDEGCDATPPDVAPHRTCGPSGPK